MSNVECSDGNTKWRRVQFADARRRERGKSNQFDGSEWLKLRADHANQYEEWTQSQTCIKMGRTDLKAEAWQNEHQVQLRPFHLERHDDVRREESGERQLHSRPSHPSIQHICGSKSV